MTIAVFNGGQVFDFHEDAGHGWMKVPLSLLDELGIKDKISSFSYISGDYGYLEEDCDAQKFHDAYTKTRGKYTVNSINDGDYSRIRKYRRFALRLPLQF